MGENRPTRRTLFGVEGSIYAGIDERPCEIGAAAIDLLHSKILTGEKGVPDAPMVAMIQGRWVPGKTVRRQRRRA